AYAARRGVKRVAATLDVHAPTRNLAPSRKDVHLGRAVAEDVHVLERLSLIRRSFWRLQALPRRSLWRRRAEFVDDEPAHTVESIRPICFPRQPLWMRGTRMGVHEHLVGCALFGPPVHVVPLVGLNVIDGHDA